MTDRANDIGQHLKDIIAEVDRIDAALFNLNKEKSRLFKHARQAGFHRDALREVIRERRKPFGPWRDHRQLVAYYYALINDDRADVLLPGSASQQLLESPRGIPVTRTEARAMGYRHGELGESDDANPCDDPDLREEWALGWQEGNEALRTKTVGADNAVPEDL